MLRYDTGEFSGPITTSNGYLKCDARITKVGVFAYRLADGTVRRELRLPSEVFRDDAMASFEDVPLTNQHPPQRQKLTPENTKKWQAGSVSRVQRHDNFLSAKVLITDGDAIKAVKQDGRRQLSCGYNCDLDFTPGVTKGIDGVPDGQHFDATQRDICGNHVAIVDRGRAGTDATLHLDAEDAVMVDEATTEPTGPAPGPVGGTMQKTMKIDGVDFELTEQAAQAVAKMMDRLDALDASILALTADLSKERARADKAEEGLEEEKKAHKEDSSDEKIAEAVRARVGLETKAHDVLKEDSLDLAKMSELEIRKAVVLKVHPAAKDRLDGADASYVAARYDGALEAWEESEKAGPPAPAGPRTVPVTPFKTDSLSARDRMLEHNMNMGRAAIPATTPDQA